MTGGKFYAGKNVKSLAIPEKTVILFCESGVIIYRTVQK